MTPYCSSVINVHNFVRLILHCPCYPKVFYNRNFVIYSNIRIEQKYMYILRNKRSEKLEFTKPRGHNSQV